MHVLQRLAGTFSFLTGRRDEPAPPSPPPEASALPFVSSADGWLRATVPIKNKLGLHARASGKLMESAARFESEITVTCDGQTVDARSIMDLMLLAARKGSQIEIAAKGADARAAMTAILALIDAKFGED
jgi:phosphocarrier protein HPr